MARPKRGADHPNKPMEIRDNFIGLPRA